MKNIPEYNTELHLPMLVQRINKLDDKPQGDGFGGGGGYYGRCNPEFYDKLVEFCRFESMGACEFEHEAFPMACDKLKSYIDSDSIFLGNFKLKCGKTIYYMCHDHLKNSVKDVLLKWESAEKIHYTKAGRNGFLKAIKFANYPAQMWVVECGYPYVFAMDVNLIKKMFLLLKNHSGIILT